MENILSIILNDNFSVLTWKTTWFISSLNQEKLVSFLEVKPMKVWRRLKTETSDVINSQDSLHSLQQFVNSDLSIFINNWPQWLLLQIGWSQLWFFVFVCFSIIRGGSLSWDINSLINLWKVNNFYFCLVSFSLFNCEDRSDDF